MHSSDDGTPSDWGPTLETVPHQCTSFSAPVRPWGTSSFIQTRIWRLDLRNVLKTQGNAINDSKVMPVSGMSSGLNCFRWSRPLLSPSESSPREFGRGKVKTCGFFPSTSCSYGKLIQCDYTEEMIRDIIGNSHLFVYLCLHHLLSMFCDVYDNVVCGNKGNVLVETYFLSIAKMMSHS